MFKNIIHSLYTKGLVAVINFLLLIISARYLGVSSRGEITVFILNLTIIQVVNEVYTGYTLIHFLPKYNIKKLFVSGLLYTLLFCSLSNSIIVFINRQVPQFEWLGYLISLLVIINTFNCVIVLGKENIGLYNFLCVLQPLLLLVGLMFFMFVLKNFTFNAYVYPLLFSFSGAMLISTPAAVKLVFKNGDAALPFHIKPMLVNGLLFQAGILMHIFCNRYSYYLLSSNAKVGLYSAAASLMESVLIIANAIAPVLLARVANLGNTRKSADVTLSLSKTSLVLGASATLIFVLLPENFFVFVLGPGFAGIRHLMLLYAPGILIVSFFAVMSNYFSAIGKLKIIVWCYSAGFVLTLLLAPWFISVYDVEGAAYIATIAYFVVAGCFCFSFLKVGKLPFRRLFSIKEDYKILKSLVMAGK